MATSIPVRAKWYWPVARPPINNATLDVQLPDRLVTGRPTPSVVDLGDVCILPSFVNAHTHLEFSDLDGPIPHQGSFASWISNLVAHRRAEESSRDSQQLADRRSQAVLRGAREAWSTGTSTLVDMVTAPWQVDHFLGSRDHDQRTTDWLEDMTIIALAEVLGNRPERSLETLDFFERCRLNMNQMSTRQSPSGEAHLQLGISPHAPYSTPLEVVELAVERARNYQCLVSMHLAESDEEREWLASGGGPLGELLARIGATPAKRSRDGVQSYLEVLSTAPKALVVHGTYLDEAALQTMVKHRDRMALVFCPRTHAYFQHAPHPWRHFLASGVRVFLGTDSRASNPDLDVLGEARFLYQQTAMVDPAILLRMMTIDPWEFLFPGAATNTNSPSKFVVVPCREGQSSEIGDAILATNEKAQPLSLILDRLLREPSPISSETSAYQPPSS